MPNLDAHITRDRVQAAAVTERTFLRLIFVDPFDSRSAASSFPKPNRRLRRRRLQIPVQISPPAAFLARAWGE